MPSRIVLRRPSVADEAELLSLARASRRLHQPWVKAPTTPTEYRSLLGRLAQPDHHGFLVCARASGQILGVIVISNVVLGVFRSGYLAYYVFAGFERQGYMREGLRAVVNHAFRRLKLHRLEANVQPANAASIALVRACGFKKEGLSPRYLKINGRWRDHERWAVLAS